MDDTRDVFIAGVSYTVPGTSSRVKPVLYSTLKVPLENVTY